ncbi:MAG: hypothetical protein JSS30_02490 [Verrucomicrobia bacterium]|nr:hypothetical protein [Verrucomicrobiota bacterium]
MSLEALRELNYVNPYKVDANFRFEASPVGQKTLADRIVDWGKGFFFYDYEKFLDVADKGTYLLDKGVMVVVGSMQGAMIADGLFHLNIVTNGPFSFIPAALKVILVPSSLFFFIIAIVESIFEFINMRRGIELLTGISKEKKAINQLEWMKKHYFSINKEESDKICMLIEEKLPNLDQTAKANRYDEIAQKALEVKFENLKRRISPGLAEEVKKQLDTAMNELSSPDDIIRETAAKRVELLMESVSTQAKTKILIHVLGLIAIFFTALSALGMFTGFGTLPFFIAVGALTAAAVALKFIVQKGGYEQRVEILYDKIAAIPKAVAATS